MCPYYKRRSQILRIMGCCKIPCIDSQRHFGRLCFCDDDSVLSPNKVCDDESEASVRSDEVDVRRNR